MQAATKEIEDELVLAIDDCVSPLVKCVMDMMGIMIEVEILLQ